MTNRLGSAGWAFRHHFLRFAGNRDVRRPARLGDGRGIGAGQRTRRLQATPVPGYRPSESAINSRPEVQESSQSGVRAGLSTTRRFGECALDHILQEGNYVPAVTHLLLTVTLFPNRPTNYIAAAQRRAGPLLARGSTRNRTLAWLPKALRRRQRRPTTSR